MEFLDKPRGVFSGLTTEQIKRFLVRNKSAFKRNSPHRSAEVEEDFMEIDDDIQNGDTATSGLSDGDRFIATISDGAARDGGRAARDRGNPYEDGRSVGVTAERLRRNRVC